MRLGKLRVFSGQDLKRLLEQHGFQRVRQRGSHMILQKQVVGSTITIPVPDHREIRQGTPRSIIRKSGLSRDFFEA
ncbi:MAG: type II toxin-antitoxin system HicA family toxin [SAR324 cluster bacterium]|nr:type II toxin-antitoxin system HicA family toxin [SAR324 cluster bacterium]